MNEQQYSALVTAANHFRAGCERYRDEHEQPFASMRNFPRGCCTLASELFLRYLRDERLGEGELLNFRRRRVDFMSNHDLVCVQGWTIDLTADQFPRERRPIIVRREVELPTSWTLLHRFTLDQLLARRTAPELVAMYQDIRSFVPTSTEAGSARPVIPRS